MADDEIRLFERIKRGDKKVFKVLFDRYYKRLYLYASSYLGDWDTAEDMVQEVFLYLWQKRSILDINSSVGSYLFASVHNRCIQNLRKLRVREHYRKELEMKLKESEILLAHMHDYSFHELDQDKIKSIIERTMEKLPEKTREIFMLSRKAYLTHAEIAQKLEISEKTVEYHITKSLKALRKALCLQ